MSRSLTTIWVIASREVHGLFVSPIAYVVLTVWMFFHGLSLWFIAHVYADGPVPDAASVSDTPLARFFGGTTLFYLAILVVVPLLTMRLLAEEQRSGTLEALLTAPVRDAEVIAGKYLAALAIWVALWAPTFLYCVVIQSYGSLDWGVVGASYLGVFWIGLSFMGIGLLMSALAAQQMVAGALTFLALGIYFVLGFGAFVFDGPSQDFFRFISVWIHMEDFGRGIVDSRYLVFHGTVAALSVFAAVRMLEARRLG